MSPIWAHSRQVPVILECGTREPQDFLSVGPPDRQIASYLTEATKPLPPWRISRFATLCDDVLPVPLLAFSTSGTLKSVSYHFISDSHKCSLRFTVCNVCLICRFQIKVSNFIQHFKTHLSFCVGLPQLRQRHFGPTTHSRDVPGAGAEKGQSARERERKYS